jgi:iron complex transport system ATP-binding protein
MADLVLNDVTAARGGADVLQGVSLRVTAGECVCLIGANGAGKSTLLRTALGLERPVKGTVRLGGEDPAGMRPALRALKAAYLPQTRPLAWPMAVRDVVALGRFAWGASPLRLGAMDAEAVATALADCDLEGLADRPTDRLSGGELARVHVGRALASHAPMLLADEPTAALDLAHGARVMSLMAGFARRGGAALVAIHDLTLAAQYATRVAILHCGRIVADGAPQAVMTPAVLRETMGVDVDIVRGPSGLVFAPRLILGG